MPSLYFNPADNSYLQAVKAESKTGIYDVVVFDKTENEEGEEICSNFTPVYKNIESLVEAEKKAFEHAKKAGYMPVICYKIKTGVRILQHDPLQAFDSKKLDKDEVIKQGKRALQIRHEIERLEAELKAETKTLKEEYGEKINDLICEQVQCESAFKDGYIDEPCQASWERDLEGGVKFFVRHDTIQAIKMLPLSLDEAQSDIFKDAEAPEKESEVQDGEYEEVNNEGEAPEIGSGSEDYQEDGNGFPESITPDTESGSEDEEDSQ